jgi:trimeric autotransporter adhesin
MKKLSLLSLLSVVLFSLAACNKAEDILPKVSMKVTKNIILPKIDTIPDNAMLKIKLCKDSVNADETTFVFNHSASTRFCYDDDALYFTGFGLVSVASISTDGKDMAIYSLPYTPGMSIGLDARTKTDGAYLFKISYKSKMPSGMQVWLKDTYLKDSVDVCKGNYNFNIIKTDTNSFGKRRFKLILKVNGQ